MAQHGLCFPGREVNYCGFRNWLNDFSRIWSGPLSVHYNKNISQESLKNCCSKTFLPAAAVRSFDHWPWPLGFMPRQS